MNRWWKAGIVAALVVSCMALGLAVAGMMMGVGFELAPVVVDTGAQSAGAVVIDLNELVLHYHDQLAGIGPQTLTVRQVIQDALWWQVYDPTADEDTRRECFSMLNLFHEGRGAEITAAEYETLMTAIRIVWGPGVIEVLEESFGGAQ